MLAIALARCDAVPARSRGGESVFGCERRAAQREQVDLRSPRPSRSSTQAWRTPSEAISYPPVGLRRRFQAQASPGQLRALARAPARCDRSARRRRRRARLARVTICAPARRSRQRQPAPPGRKMLGTLDGGPAEGPVGRLYPTPAEGLTRVPAIGEKNPLPLDRSYTSALCRRRPGGVRSGPDVAGIRRLRGERRR